MMLLSDRLRGEYNRDIALLPDERFPEGFTQYADVIKAHYLICDYFESIEGCGGLFGVKNVNMLCSAIARQVVEFNGIRKWNDDYEVAATLFFGLVKNHPFHDGNKRTALLALLNHLYNKRIVPSVPIKEFELLTVHVAESNWQLLHVHHANGSIATAEVIDSVIRRIARLLRKMTRPCNNRFRFVTYAELERALKRFGYYFRDPYHNSIDVYKRTKKKILGFETSQYIDRKIANIGFPGMKRQVGKAALKSILNVLGLDEKNGFDRSCIFDGAEPLYKMIQKYEGPLRRLRDK